MKKFYKRPVVIVSAIIVVIILVAVVQKFVGGNGENKFDFITAQKSELIQEVSVTGNVKAVDNIALSFETSGIVNKIEVSDGDVVIPGQILATLKSTELLAELTQASANLESQRAMEAQAQASLESAEVTLNEYKDGTRSEEIQIAQTTVNNAQATLNNAEINLTNTSNNAEIALNALYNNVDNILHDAYTKADDTVSTKTDIFFTNDFTDSPKFELLLSSSSLKNSAQNQRSLASQSLLNIQSSIATLDTYDHISTDESLSEARNDLYQIRTLMTTLSSALNHTVSETQANITTYRGYINTGQTNINTAISNIDSQIQQITTQKATNEYNIATAQASVTTAQNTLNSAEENLSLKNAGYTDRQITGQELAVKQARANLLSQKAQVRQAQATIVNAQARFEKTILKSPAHGIITNKEIEVGELISSTEIIFTVISEANYQIEANIPEIDVAKVELGDTAITTLDAYGSSKEFEVKVISINPAEKIIEGVPTYKTTFEFITNESLAKSGMTANIEIRTDYREAAIAIPQRAVKNSGVDKTIKVLNLDGETFEEVPVTVGLRGSDGRVEILSGINIGDKVIISINE